MVSLKRLLQKPSRASFSPLLKAGAVYLTQISLKNSLKNPNLNMDSSSHLKSLFSGLLDLLSSRGSFGQPIEVSSLEIFGDFLIFMLLMVILNVIILLFTRVKEYFSHKRGHSKKGPCQLPREDARRAHIKRLESFEILNECGPDHEESLIKKLIKPLIKASLCYTLAFCFFEIALFSAFTLYGSEKIFTGLQSQNLPLYSQLRALEETTPAILPANKEPEKVSLAMGRVLASFDVEPTLIAMSQDEKWAYVSTDNPQLIRVYDTSDFKAPVQVAAVNLGRLSRARMFLELSPDGTILVASNYDDVKIINVTNPSSPQLVGSFFNPMLISADGMVFVSMAISPDNKYLFIAEVAFAILDISNPSSISLLYTSKDMSSHRGSLISLSASRDRKLVYLTTGKGALETYNVTDPRNPQVISTVSFNDSSANSVFLSKDDKLAYVVGMSGKKIAVNILDVSSPLNVKEVSKFTVFTIKYTTPIIQALSPQETKLYILQQRLMVIDLVTMSVESNSENLVKNSLLSICFSSSGQYAGVAYLEQIVFIELFTNYPNTKIFTPSNTSTASFVVDQRFESWAVNKDGNVLFLAVNDYERLNSSFEIWNIKNKGAPKRIASFNATQLGVGLTAPFLSFKMSPDYQRAYLKWWTWDSSKLTILDLSGDLTIPKKLKEYEVSLTLNFEDFIFSKNEKILCVGSDESVIKLYNLESSLQVKTAEIEVITDLNTDNFDMAFAKNDTILLVITSKISVYNVSNVSDPVFLGSFSMTEGGSPRVLSVVVVEEEDSLIVEWYQTSRKLRVYNISDIVSPRLVSELPLPKRTFSSQKDILFEFYGPFIYSESQKLGYVATNGKLLRVDLSDLKNPAISGIVPVPACEECGISRFIISPDGSTTFATNQTGMLRSLVLTSENFVLYQGSDLSSEIFAVDLQTKFTLYIPQERFLLGERYSDNIFILKNFGGKQGYQVAPRAQSKVLSLYAYDVQVVSSEPAPKVITFSLPDWIKFNQDTFLLTVEAKSKKDLGVYTICSAISNQVSKFALDNIGPVNDTFKVSKILTTLVSLGYMDRQFYLTTEFGTREDFFLPEEFGVYKGEIYDILSKYYIEACTKIGIEPSLDVSIVRPVNRIWIDTTSTEALKIDITLLVDKDNSNAQFLNKAYGPLIPEVRDQKSRIVLEGSLSEIHAALQHVIINAQNGTSYDGLVSVSDGLNYPIVNRRIGNISECFLKNSPPFENPNASKTFQEQLERVSVATGQYFTIMWDENTFQDQFAESLHYEVMIDNDADPDNPKAFPDWLSFSNLALRGTPPEKLTDREISLKFVAKNEFQNVTIPFKLQIGISPTFALSLLIKYSPMLLTALGFYIKANMIYNIVAKKRYKHSKEYQVQVGQEISVPPVLFIEKELKESRAIIKQLLKYLKKNNESELVSYFVDEGSRVLDKNKVIESINQVVSSLPSKEKKKLSIYLDGSDFNRKKVIQIIFNKIVMLQLGLPQEKPTKLAFENIKDQWADLVEWSPELIFIVNKEKLSEILEKESPSLKTEEESPSLLGEYRQEINQDLLQDALISHIFSHQSLDARSTMVLIEAHERFERNKIQVFLKQDLEGSHLNSKSSIDYGFHCRLEDGMLVFSGAPKENFKGRTLAIQIQNIQLRILKEIWIQEKSAGLEKSTIELSSRTESSLRGHAYEVY